jgi:hypothetical protein
MKMPYREVLFAACMAFCALDSGAASQGPVVLDEVDVKGVQDREREQLQFRTVRPEYAISVQRKGITIFQVVLPKFPGRKPQTGIRFRRQSSARQLAGESANSRRPAQAVRMSGDQALAADNEPLATVFLALADNVDEADGLPASIPFGPQAALVNLDHVRLRDVPAGTGIEVSSAIDPVTRRCTENFVIYDEGTDFPNRFVLLANSRADCRRIERGREGDLIFADSVPEQLRQAVRDMYDAVANRIANRLGGEAGQVFVAWWPEAPRGGYRFELSWHRNSLLLFNGAQWREGLDSTQRDALWNMFVAEQIQRRIIPPDMSDLFADSAAGYLQGLVTAGQAGNTDQWLTDALPGWIAGCARSLKNAARVAAARGKLASIDCGMLVQFVYDAVARAESAGGEGLYDTWRDLLTASYRRGDSGAKPADFLGTSTAAQRIVAGLLDGTVDWLRFAAELDGIGVRMLVNPDPSATPASVQSLTYFRN